MENLGFSVLYTYLTPEHGLDYCKLEDIATQFQCDSSIGYYTVKNVEQMIHLAQFSRKLFSIITTFEAPHI